MNINEIKLDLEKNLSYHRYSHSCRVAEVAKDLAKYYGANENDAYIAGLLHDIAKEFTKEETNNWITKYHLPSYLTNEDNIKTCHAEVGAIVAKALYNVNDNIMNAIKYHTIGNINMTLLDKIIFIADKIEAGKNYPGIEEERELAYKDIDKALILCLENNKKKLLQENKPFNKDSNKVLEYLLTNK